MKYFVTNAERQGTCYHEFYKGKWDGRSFRRDDSICLHDDILGDAGGFAEIIFAVVPTYAPLGVTEISPEQWKQIGKLAEVKGGRAGELFREADEWAEDVFKIYDCFTILGI